MATTLLSNLFDPEVVGDLVEQKYTDNMVFAPLATIDNTLANQPGSVLTLPHFSFVGAAEALAENSELSMTALVESTVSVSVCKIAKGITISDEAVLSGYGDPMGEAVNQLGLAMAAKTDNMLYDILHGISGDMLYSTSASTVDPADTDINLALEKFGEDVDGVKVVVVSPAVYTAMRGNTNSWVPASEVAANIAVKGIVGEYMGCQVIVSNKVKTSKEIFIVKPGALRIILKRGVMIEFDRDITNFTNVITASKHLAAYLYDATKAIRIATRS